MDAESLLGLSSRVTCDVKIQFGGQRVYIKGVTNAINKGGSVVNKVIIPKRIRNVVLYL